MAKQRTARVGAAEARVRLRAAQAYLEVADLTLDKQGRDEFLDVAAGLAVLAGVAASDAICDRRLGRIHRGASHRAASGLLAQSTPDGATLASMFLRLLDVKDEAHYGVDVISASKARSTVRWARHLVDRAREEVER